MNDTVDFTAELNTNFDAVERPRPLPAGSYTMIIKNKELGRSKQKGTPYVRYFVSPIAPREDVPLDELEAMADWRETELRLDFYITPKSNFRIKEFLEALGVSTAGRTIADLIDEPLGKTIIGAVRHEPSNRNDGTMFAVLDSYVPEGL